MGALVSNGEAQRGPSGAELCQGKNSPVGSRTLSREEQSRGRWTAPWRHSIHPGVRSVEAVKREKAICWPVLVGNAQLRETEQSSLL